MSKKPWALVLSAAVLGLNTLGGAVLADKEKAGSGIEGVAQIPDTPSGRRLKGWLQAMAGGSKEAVEAFIEASYEPEERKRRPARDRAFRMMAALEGFGARHPIQLVQSGEWETTIVGEAALMEEWMKVTVRVSPEPPHRIAGLMLQPGEPPAGPGRAARPGEVVPRARAFAEKLAAADRFSGVLLLARGDEILFQGAYGPADKEKKVLNRTDTRFGLASMGKMFTAVAVAQLVEAGKLRYEDTLAQALPDYPNREVAAKVTIHQLLTHTAGMGDFFDKPGFAGPSVKRERPRDYFPLFADEPLKFEPGRGWEYSNAGFIVLGAVIERASGQDYHTYVRERIFKPAGLTRTGYALGGADVPDLAMGYTRMESEAWRRGPSDGAGGPAGGGYSTAGDLFRFARALLSHRLISAKSLERLTASHAKTTYGPGLGYGYGFMLQGADGARSFGHAGGFPGVCTQFDVYPQEEVVCVILSNYDPPAGTKIAGRVRQMVTQTKGTVAKR